MQRNPVTHVLRMLLNKFFDNMQIPSKKVKSQVLLNQEKSLKTALMMQFWSLEQHSGKHLQNGTYNR